MHRNASECVRMRQNASECIRMRQRFGSSELPRKGFLTVPSECIRFVAVASRTTNSFFGNIVYPPSTMGRGAQAYAQGLVRGTCVTLVLWVAPTGAPWNWLRHFPIPQITSSAYIYIFINIQIHIFLIHI